MKRESWLPAAPEGAPQARAIVREAASELQLDGEVTWELMLATTEAFANAVEHGSPCDARGIFLRVETEADGIGVEVCDGGGSVPGPRRSPKPPREGGRGLPIMEAVMDRFEFRPGEGLTRVRFEKRLAAV